MATTTFKVDGLRQLGERMRLLSSDVAKKTAGQATGAAARLVKKHAINNLQRSPSIDTGLLVKNVIYKKLGKRDTTMTSEHIVTVRKRTYPDGKATTRMAASFLEFGTVNMPNEEFLRPALENNVDEVTKAMVDALRDRIAKAER